MKILMIIAQKGFRDEEYQIPYDYFIEKEISVDVASEQKGQCIGQLGLFVDSDIALKDVVIQEYFAVVIVGGQGAGTLFGNSDVERILKEAKEQNIVISAICYSPAVLAHAGILKGKKATVWNGDGKQEEILIQGGAEFVDEDVVTDGLVVTANGPSAALKFAEEVVRVCECEDCWIK